MSDKPKILTVAEIDEIARDGAALPDEYAALLRMARAMARVEADKVEVWFDDVGAQGWSTMDVRGRVAEGLSAIEAIEATEEP